jgi:hypothetical protein
MSQNAKTGLHGSALVAIFLLFSTFNLQAGDPATLSGTVTETGSGTPLADVTVVVSDLALFQASSWIAETQTDSVGNFEVEVSMDPGQSRSLIIEAAGPNHAPGRHNGSSDGGCYFNCGGDEGAFTVSEGDSIAGLDIALDPGGRIAGLVTAATDGSPLESIRLDPMLPTETGARSFSPHFQPLTASDGTYLSALALPDGEYYLRAVPPPGINVVEQAWQGYPCQHRTCPILDTESIEITAGQTTSDLDFSMKAGATISGTLQPEDEPRIVRLYDGAGIMLGQFVFYPWELPGTEYSFNQLSGGSYYIELGAFADVVPLIRQLHNGLFCPFSGCERASGVPITIPPASSLTLSEIELQTGGQIDGTIVDAATGDTPPIEGAGSSPGTYDIIEADGTVVGGGTILIDNETGELRLRTSSAVPGGEYYVRTFTDWNSSGIGYNAIGGDFPVVSGYSDAMYPDVPCAGVACDINAAQPVTVTVGDTTSITIEISTGSNISGTVIDDDTDEPIHRGMVKLVNADGDMLAAVITDEQGEFSFGAFPAGDYFLRTSMSGNLGIGHFGVQNRYFDHVHGATERCSELLCDPQSGSAVSVDGVNDIDSLEFRVEPGPVISGRIIFAFTGLLINNGYVEAYDDNGTLVGRYRINPSSGRYQTTALEPGDYTLVPVVSPAFSDVTTVGGNLSQTSTMARGSSGSLVVSVGNEDVDVDLRMIDTSLDMIFDDRFE